MSNRQHAETYKEWLGQIKNFEGGLLGTLIVLLTVPFTFYAAYQGLNMFPPGEYPRLVLALPGLLSGILFFFALTGLFWRVKRKS